MKKKVDNKAIGAKLRSLMERTDKRMTLFEAMDNERGLIEESKRVNVSSFLEFLTKYTPNKGKFATLGYIQLYPTDAAYPTDDYYSKLDSASKEVDSFGEHGRGLARLNRFLDKSQNPEWDNPTGKKKRGEDIKAMGQKLYPYILKMTSYTLNWQTHDAYEKLHNDAQANLSSLKSKMSLDTRRKLFPRDFNPDGSEKKKEDLPKKSPVSYLPIGQLGSYDVMTYADKETKEPVEQEYFTDIDKTNRVGYERTAIKAFLRNIEAQRPVYFGVDENGNVDPIPKSLGKLLHNTETNYDSKLAQLSDPNEIALAKDYFSALKANSMVEKTFLMHNVAYIACRAAMPGGSYESVYWINDKPLFLLQKEKTVNKVTDKYKYAYSNIDNEQLKSVLDNYVRNYGDEMLAKGNANIEGDTMYADDSLNESRKPLNEMNELYTEWYDEEDYDGHTGEEGMIRSYDIGYYTMDNAENDAEEHGYDDVSEYLQDWFDEVQPDAPWYWTVKGGGYGYNGTTIFKNGGLVCKEIYGQIMFDEYPIGY